MSRLAGWGALLAALSLSLPALADGKASASETVVPDKPDTGAPFYRPPPEERLPPPPPPPPREEPSHKVLSAQVGAHRFGGDVAGGATEMGFRLGIAHDVVGFQAFYLNGPGTFGGGFDLLRRFGFPVFEQGKLQVAILTPSIELRVASGHSNTVLGFGTGITGVRVTQCVCGAVTGLLAEVRPMLMSWTPLSLDGQGTDKTRAQSFGSVGVIAEVGILF